MTTQKWPDWFVYMQEKNEGNVRGWKGPSGNQGEFDLRFTPIKEDFYLISTARWRNRYFYLKDIKDARVRGSEGDPGSQGHWRIIPRDDGSFMLSTEQWPSWFIYM